MVQTRDNRGIYLKYTPETLSHLKGKNLARFIDQTNEYARMALDDVEEASNEKAY